MNGAHSAQEYRLATFAAPREHDERPVDGSSEMPVDVVALPEDRPGTSGLPARTTSEVTVVSSAFQLEASGVLERSVLSRNITGRRRRQRRRARTPGMTREETNIAERNRMDRIREALNGLRDELPDKFKNRTHRRANIQKKFVVAYTVDYLNELGGEIIRLTDNINVSGSAVQRFSGSVEQFSASALITRKTPRGNSAERENYRHEVITQAVETLRETLAGLGINASGGMTDSDLERMRIDLMCEGLEPFKRKFSEILTLQVALEMIRALKAQRDQLLPTISDKSQ
ncbi:helix-loop-helix domain-containing protein [Kistimonas asteriae]|uniref:basic helix-loop-helix domain-containing protein n=1 Tax=Kistimonas asteriae TaxID=517724 RepID=UPI0031B87BE8